VTIVVVQRRLVLLRRAVVAALAVVSSAGPFGTLAASGCSARTPATPNNDGGLTCPPSLAAGFKPATKTTPIQARACADEDLIAYRRDCLSLTTSTQEACRAWAGAHATCFACAYTREDAEKWGPVVIHLAPGDVPLSNVGGCIIAMQASAKTCGTASISELDCVMKACKGCQYPAGVVAEETRSTALEQFNVCVKAAQAVNGKCETYTKAAAQCVTSLQPATVQVCTRMGTEPDAFFAALTAMCGDGVLSTDAGANPAPSDASSGAPDAADGSSRDAGDSG